jgi:hypothetical protein
MTRDPFSAFMSDLVRAYTQPKAPNSRKWKWWSDGRRRRRTIWPGALPVVQLATGSMLTRYGQRPRPDFQIIDWRGGTSAAPGRPNSRSKSRPRTRMARHSMTRSTTSHGNSPDQEFDDVQHHPQA